MTRILTIIATLPWMVGASLAQLSDNDETLQKKSSVKQDFLRFSNGDQLHGAYQGLVDGSAVSWHRDDVTSEVDFNPSEIRQVVLRGGRPKVALPSLSNLVLVNGDRVPGQIQLVDGNSVVIETTYAGLLQFPRASVAMLAPSPLGGRVIYQGPFADDEWEMVDPEPIKPAEEEAEATENELPWRFSGAAWYAQRSNKGTALVQKHGMPDRSILRFKLAWRNRLSVAVAFHADFAQPAQDGEQGDHPNHNRRRPGEASAFPWTFGNSYVLQLSPNYVILYRAGFNEDGEPTLDPIRTNNSNMRLNDSEDAVVEIRCNRLTGDISFFVDGDFIAQWSEPVSNDDDEGSHYAGGGEGFGFVVSPNNTNVRISEITVAEWNGMPDSARSLQAEGFDIVLLNNGTDRFSGELASLKEGDVQLNGRYGSFQFPLEDIAEIHFAKKGLLSAAARSSDQIAIHMLPVGRITGKPIAGSENSIRLLHPYAGEIEVDLSAAVILDFNPSDSYLDAWDDEF